MTNNEFGHELFHYTNEYGLRGIFESGTIFSTRYDCLNDSSEILHFKDILTCLVAQQLKRDLDYSSARYNNQHAELVVNQLYEEAFNTKNGRGVPYITSFCSHHDDQIYEKENGLLSQWRAYGGNERYALVFDTAALFDLKKQECDAHDYVLSAFCKVTYHNENSLKEPKYAELASNIVELIRANKNQDKAEAQKWAIPVYVGILTHSISFKHRAFSEEREVRMVFSPETNFVNEIDRNNQNSTEKRPMKQIFLHPSSKNPTIRLFEGLGLAKNLPLSRIIVGPSKNQEEAFRIAEKITKGTVKLTRSETPFI